MSVCNCGNHLLSYPLSCLSCDINICAPCGTSFDDVALCIPCRDKLSQRTCDHCKSKHHRAITVICDYCAGMYCSGMCNDQHSQCNGVCEYNGCNSRIKMPVKCEYCNSIFCETHKKTHIETTRCLGYHPCRGCYRNVSTATKNVCRYDTCQTLSCYCIRIPKLYFPICPKHRTNVSKIPCYFCDCIYPDYDHAIVRYPRKNTSNVKNSCLTCYNRIQAFADCLILKQVPCDIIEYLIYTIYVKI